MSYLLVRKVQHIKERISPAGCQHFSPGGVKELAESPLEPDVIEEKDYAPGVGLIQEREVGGATVDLVEYVAGSA